MGDDRELLRAYEKPLTSSRKELASANQYSIFLDAPQGITLASGLIPIAVIDRRDKNCVI